MLTVHHLENSRSQRILWLLEELGVEYEIKHYARDPKTQLAPDSLREVHPLGRSPVITDGDQTIAESGVIIDYLISRYGPELRPDPADEAYFDYQYWLHYAEGSLMPLLLLKLVFDRISKPPMPLILRPAAALIALGMRKSFIGPRLKQNFDYIEGVLADREWLVGDRLRGADIQMSFPLEAAASRGDVLEGRPAIAAFVKRVHARPAYLAALEKGGPYEYGPA
ncbi:MAG: glutathione S-transferase [Pseudomonadota bacterium]